MKASREYNRKKFVSSLLNVILVLGAFTIVFPLSAPTVKADTFWYDNWTIPELFAVYHEDDIIYVNGTLTIEGTLTLVNCQLFMRYKTSGDPGNLIWVKNLPAGEFDVLGNTIITTDPSNPDPYNFTIEGKALINNSIVENMADLTGEVDGIQIYNSNVKISNSTIRSSNGNGIYINNVNPTIKNSNIYDNSHYGVYMRSVNNCLFENNNVSSNNDPGSNALGIYLYESNHNSIANNTVTNNRFGIFLEKSHNNAITNNTAFSNDYDDINIFLSNSNIVANNTLSSNNRFGIYLSHSSCATIINNTMVDEGIFIGGSNLEHWNTHIIDTTNTVNNKPVYYWKNQTGGVIPSGAGEVILANCTNVKVQNQNISDVSCGIELGFSPNNTIANNTASSNNWDGIYTYKANNNTIINNTASSNKEEGIIITYSSYNLITSNIASGNGKRGIRVLQSDNNTVINNTTPSSNTGILLCCGSNDNTVVNNNASNNHYGIVLSGTSNNNITGNNASLNSYDGIYLYGSTSNIIYNNTIGWNKQRAGIYCTSGSTATITYNDILSNKLYGVWSGSGSDPVIHNNTITGHYNPATGEGYGVYNAYSSITIDAKNNWWGDPDNTGPYDPSPLPPDHNPDGTGDRVSDYVYYRPWLPPP